MATKSTTSPQTRLLEAANKLFYEDGINAVGVERLLAESGVAKASLYSAFGSKNGLVRAYLEHRKAEQLQGFADAIATAKKPRDQILAILDCQALAVADPGFRGCAFSRADGEGDQERGAKQICADYRTWLRGTFVDLARAAGASEPEALAQQLVLLYDGVATAAQMDKAFGAAASAREIASLLIDAATKKKR